MSSPESRLPHDVEDPSVTNQYSADLAPILEAIADRAARLCESQDARIFVVDGDVLRYVAGFGEVPFLPVDPIRPLTRGLPTGRAVIDRAVVHIDDMAAAGKEFPEVREYQRQSGNRTTLSVPLVRGDKAIGVILLRRSEVSLCTVNPGFPEELCLRATRRTLIGWWRGDLTFRQALEAGLVLEGRREWVRAFPSWFERYLFVAVTPASRATSARRARPRAAPVPS